MHRLLSLFLLAACAPVAGPVTAPLASPSAMPKPEVSPQPTASPAPSAQPTPLPQPTVGSSAVPLVPEASPSPLVAVSNSLGMQFVPIPAGSFEMGSPENEAERRNDETRHRVTLSRPFLLQTMEVTQRQWRAVMDANNSFHQQPDDPARPVENVSWEQIQSFIEKLNARQEGTYRLPTEAEWEYAARAGTDYTYGFGNNVRYLGNYAWFAGSLTSQLPRPQVGGQKQANAFGLYDMWGNVAEFVQDGYAPFSSEASIDPSRPATSSHRVYRGCSYADVASQCRIALRQISRPNQAPEKGTVGFRLVRE